MRNLLKEIETTIETHGVMSRDGNTIAMETETLSDHLDIDRYSLEAIGKNLYEIIEGNFMNFFIIQV